MMLLQQRETYSKVKTDLYKCDQLVGSIQVMSYFSRLLMTLALGKMQILQSKDNN